MRLDPRKYFTVYRYLPYISVIKRPFTFSWTQVKTATGGSPLKTAVLPLAAKTSVQSLPTQLTLSGTTPQQGIRLVTASAAVTTPTTSSPSTANSASVTSPTAGSSTISSSSSSGKYAITPQVVQQGE